MSRPEVTGAVPERDGGNDSQDPFAIDGDDEGQDTSGSEDGEEAKLIQRNEGEQRRQQQQVALREGGEQSALDTSSLPVRGSEDSPPRSPPPLSIPIKEKEAPITWSSLPHKSQLAILTIARFAEPLVQTSLRSYLFYQLRWFDESLPSSTIASQFGIIQATFAAGQLCTAALWGGLSDGIGRKRVLMLGLSGTMISCIGMSFSTKFWHAILFRLMAGALNGNIGVMRTMVSEIVREKKYQSRAFLLLPMCSNIGTIVGPIAGGLLADPATNYPSIFGSFSLLKNYPYALPNLVNAFFLITASCAVFFGLEETHDKYANDKDIGRSAGKTVVRFGRRLMGKGSGQHKYSMIPEEDAGAFETSGSNEVEMSPATPRPKKRAAPRYRNKLPFRRIFTYNVVCTLLANGLVSGCIGTFNSIWYTFLSTPVYNPQHPPKYAHKHNPPIFFTGGVGLPPSAVGLAMAILGVIGISLQLFVYPWVNNRIGTVRSWRIFLYCFPVVYLLAPFLALVPSTTPPPSEKTGALIWICLIFVVSLQTIGRTFAIPANTILLNNCSPHPSVLGTIHGIGHSAGSGAKTFGPAVGGWIYGLGLKYGIVGIEFWVLGVMALVTCAASNFVRDGNGHEIRLEGDDEAEAEAEALNHNRTI